MPSDYWNQFLNAVENENLSPPYNPATHNPDGTPKTPECRPVPQSMLGPLDPSSKHGSALSRTPMTPRFGNRSKEPAKRPKRFFESPKP